MSLLRHAGGLSMAIACGCSSSGSTTASNGAGAADGMRALLVAVGSNDFACAVRIGGTPWCWKRVGGAAPGGPQQVSGLADVRQIGIGVARGIDQACALSGDGSVRCWTNGAAPNLIGDIPPAVRISVGHDLFCALAADGSVRCWGQMLCGSSNTCVVTTVASAIDLSGGADSHACALLAGGRVACWGYDGFGEVGGGPQPSGQASTTFVPGVAGALSVVVAEGHTSALLEDRQVLCWGNCGSGNAFVPTLITNMRGVVDLGDGANFDNCVRTSDRQVRCACLGVPGDALTTYNQGSPPACDFSFRLVPRLDDVVDVSTSPHWLGTVWDSVACAARDDGSVWCWGPGAAIMFDADAGSGDASPDPARVPLSL